MTMRYFSGSLSTGINGERVNCDLQLLHTLTSLVDNSDSPHDPTVPETSDYDSVDYDSEVSKAIYIDSSHRNDLESTASESEQRPLHIRYGFRKDSAALCNSWEDPLYFTAAFPTLFPTGAGGHLDNRPVKVSLEAFAKWALSHHSRR
jgi:hypothetical protein